MSNSNSPAYPAPYSAEYHSAGLNKREEIASKAMQGMLSNGTLIDMLLTAGLDNDQIISAIAVDAVKAADTLLEALK